MAWPTRATFPEPAPLLCVTFFTCKGTNVSGTVDLERTGHEKAACFSHFRDGALTENPKPFGSGERLSAAASLEKTALALGALTEPADPLAAPAE